MRERDAAKDGRQKGAQEHAEGQHGEKTHSRLLEELHSGGRDEETDEGVRRRDVGERDAED
jgi:hypothetical protein